MVQALCQRLHLASFGIFPKLIARDVLRHLTDKKRIKEHRKGYPKPFYLFIAERWMNSSGEWVHMPFGSRIDDLTDYELIVMQAAEMSLAIKTVWAKPPEKRTPQDYEFMSWANSCLE